MNFFHYMFTWYGGAVWPNILASLICGISVLLFTRFLYRKLKRHVEKLFGVQEQHHTDIQNSLALLHHKIDNQQKEQ